MKITPRMGDAWVSYETAEQIPTEWNWHIASRMLKHAFMSGYAAAQAIEAQRAETAQTGSVADESAVAESDAPKGDA